MNADVPPPRLLLFEGDLFLYVAHLVISKGFNVRQTVVNASVLILKESRYQTAEPEMGLDQTVTAFNPVAKSILRNVLEPAIQDHVMALSKDFSITKIHKNANSSHIPDVEEMEITTNHVNLVKIDVPHHQSDYRNVKLESH